MAYDEALAERIRTMLPESAFGSVTVTPVSV